MLSSLSRTLLPGLLALAAWVRPASAQTGEPEAPPASGVQDARAKQSAPGGLFVDVGVTLTKPGIALVTSRVQVG